MTDRLSHLKLAMDLGFQLGQGKKVDLSEMADKHLTKDCPDCGGTGECPDNADFGGECDNGKVGGDAGERPWEIEDCPKCDGTGECPRCKGTRRVPA